MRVPTIVILAATTVGLAGCGSVGSPAASRPAPPAPITLSAYVDAGAVRVSPARIGAGPVLLVVADQSPTAAALVVSRVGSRSVLARTAPINPDGVTQLKLDLPRGTYTVAAIAAGRRSDAQRARAANRPRTTTLRVGARRASSGDQVLQP